MRIRKALTNLTYENTDLKSKYNTLNTDQQSMKNQIAFLNKYLFAVDGVVQTKEDVEELQGFLEKMRKAKEEKNRLPDGEEE